MTVALVPDVPSAARERCDAVVERMHLDGRTTGDGRDPATGEIRRRARSGDGRDPATGEMPGPLTFHVNGPLDGMMVCDRC